MIRPKRKLTSQDYLAAERCAESKSEYYAGETFAMTGASRRHNLPASGLVATLVSRLGDRCEIYPSDMRVKVSSTGLYTYPDVVVVCGEPEFEDAVLDTL